MLVPTLSMLLESHSLSNRTMGVSYGEACKRCTCAKCGSGLGKGSEPSSQSPPNINHCCYECGDPLDGIFCKRCLCKSCGKDAHIGYNCPSKVSVISNLEPCNNQTIDELPQTLPFFHPTFQSEAESPFTLDSTPTYVDESPNLNSTLAKIKDQMTSITSLCELACQVAQKKLEEKQIEEEHAAKAKYWKLPVCYDDDDEEERSDSLNDNIISGLPPFSAITPDEPVLSIEEPDNSLIWGTSILTPFCSEVMEIVILEVGGIDDDILLTINHYVLRKKLLNVNLLIAKIKALNANPTLSSDCKTKSSSTSLNSLLEETNTFDNSLPKFENFCFDVEKISSGSTTIHPNISLPEYEVFHDDHVKETSSGSPTTHSDSSLYASFIFDLSINSFPPADRSDSYEFIDKCIPFISAPEYDCFAHPSYPSTEYEVPAF
nr:hypothetical protein [Tanacetum cinerariifolium]